MALPTGSGTRWWSRSKPWGLRRRRGITARPGIPTTVTPSGTGAITTELAAMRTLLPTAIGPRILAPAPTVTPSPRVGWRLPGFQLVPPRVTPWYSVTSVPISAVSPITTPTPWSMKKRAWMRAAGWMSIWVNMRATKDSQRGR